MSVKSDISIKVKESLFSSGNEKTVSDLMQKMMKLYEKKHSLNKEEPVLVYGDRIWLGNYCYANNPQFLEMNEIKAVVSCLEHPLNVTLPSIVYRKYALKDGADHKFQEHVMNFLDFLSNQPGNIYVHCFSGRSRSAAFVVALIMKDLKKTYKEALEELRKVYPFAAPHSYFESTLTKMQPVVHTLKKEKVEQSVNLLDEDLSPPPSPKKSSSSIKEQKIKSPNEVNLLDIEEAKPVEPPIPFDYLQQANTYPFETVTQQISIPQENHNLINLQQTETIEISQPNEVQLLDLHQEPIQAQHQAIPQPTPTDTHENNLIDLTTKTQTTGLDLLQQPQKVQTKPEAEEQQFVDSTDFTQKKKKNKKKKK